MVKPGPYDQSSDTVIMGLTPPPPWRYDNAGQQEGPGRILRYRSGYKTTFILRILVSSGETTKKSRKHKRLSHAERYKKTYTAHASHTPTATANHGEFIVIGSD